MTKRDNKAAEQHAANRRDFLTVGGAAAIGMGAVALGATQSASAQTTAAAVGPQPARVENVKFDAEYDIVVVGGGGGGFPSALISRWLGNSVVILEKAAAPGGTAQKAAFWYWVPNNEPMRAMGLTDPKPDFLRYVARLSQPQSYDPNDPRFGLSEWEYAMCEAIYDSASPAAQLLHDKGALVYRHVAPVPDYFAELPEDKAPKGRVLVPNDARPSMSDGGAVAIASMSRAAERDGVDVRTRHRVQRVVMNGNGEVVGVEATTPKGNVFVRARKAVIFATGGYTHNPDLRKNFLSIPIYGGCAALSNEGDFVRISSTLGVQLRNMNYAW
jgi:3-oxosteroid 1-dehydrogenase